MDKVNLLDNITVLDFDKWKKKPEIAEMYAQVTECTTCYGTGSHECECGDLHTCGDCNGAGKEKDLREIYEKELRAEIQHLHEWINGEKTKTPSLPEHPKPGINIPVILDSTNGG
jgi:DnaJ-class molecular chaperone